MRTTAVLPAGIRVCAVAIVLTAWGAGVACGPGAEEESPEREDTLAAAAGDGDTVGAIEGGAPAARDTTTGGARERRPTPPARDTGEGRRTDAPRDTPAVRSEPPDTVEGTVRRVGNVPFVMTVVQGTDTVQVTGRLEEELARASGILVRVVGRPVTGRYPGPTLEVSSYRLLSVSGETPHVGRLREDREGYYLETQDAGPYRLGAVPRGLQDELGAKVWVLTSDAGAVQQYGVLRPADAEER